MTEPLLSERIAEDEITIQTAMIDGMSADGLRYRWDVSLHRPDAQPFTLPDPFESNDEPTAFDVLDLVTSACSIVSRADSREEWASEYTTDPEEQEKHFTEEHWQTWLVIDRRLREFLGSRKHQDYLYCTNRSS